MATNNSNSTTKIVRLKDLLDIESGGVLEISSGGDVNVESGGQVNVKSGGELLVESGGIFSSASELKNTTNDGTVVTGVSAVVHGDGVHNRFTLTLDDFAIGNSGDNASLGLGAKIFTLDAGVWAINFAAVNVGITIADEAAQAQTPVLGLGTVVASGAVAVLSGTATFQNIVAGSAVADLAGTAKVINTPPTANVPLAIASGGSHDIFLNLAVAWADIAAASPLVANGTIVLDCTKLA